MDRALLSQRRAVDQLAQIRTFNRLVAQWVGQLADSFLRRGRPLGQARLLHEIGRKGAEVGALRRRLGLDSGYVSRLLRSLEEQGLVVSAPTERDGRRRVVRLSSKGHRELAAYRRCFDAFAEAMLEHLSESQRVRLVGAMAEIERLLAARLRYVRACHGAASKPPLEPRSARGMDTSSLLKRRTAE